MNKLKVLIACEFSGIVRNAFAKRGHDAWSCDLLPTELPGKHIQGDVLERLNDGWDMMIAFPPCTYLSYAGIRHWNNPGRCLKRLHALDFFRRLWEAPINKICIENPKGCASPTIAKYTQIIQPYFFGDRELKTTCLWQKNLSPLKYAKEDTLFEKRTSVERPEPFKINKRNKKVYFTERIRDPYKRSITFRGVAEAMATQWG